MLRAARFDEQRLNGNPRRISGNNPKALVSRKIEAKKLAPLSIINNGIVNALEDVMAIRYGSETWAICKLIKAQKHTNNIEAVRLLDKAITAVRLGKVGPKAHEGWISK